MLQVTDAGFLSTVQDLGRMGAMRLGVPIGGAIDRFALIIANRLVGNEPGAACIECYGEGPLFVAQEELLIAGAGRGYALVAGTCSYPLWLAVYVPRGEMFGLRSAGAAGWGYLAVSGGLNTPLVLESRSTFLRAGFGGLRGRTLQFGDQLAVLPPQLPGGLNNLAGRNLPKTLVPAYSDQIELRVTAYPQQGELTPASLLNLYAGEYFIKADSDRMGYRLQGPVLKRTSTHEVLTEGATSGTIQVPGDGQPLVLMCDSQTTGGYPKVGVVASVDMPLLAQCPLETGRVRFRQIPLEEAQEAYQHQARLVGCDFWEEENIAAA